MDETDHSNPAAAAAPGPGAGTTPSGPTRPGLGARLVRGLATLSVAVYLVPATLAMASLAILLSWVPPRGNLVVFICRVWARGALAAGGVRLEVEMHRAVDPRRGYVVMANHCSYFDVLALLAVLPGQYRIVAKRSLFLIPIFGWALRANGFIPVDRHDRSRAREIWAAAGDRLSRGASVLFYPEGTRSLDGCVHAFQRGAFLVAMHNDAPILPVGVHGAWPIMPRQRFSVQPGPIGVRIGEPVETAGRSVRDKRELIEQVRREVARLAGAELV
jgi:1-acyl-sn-glycerol-3-phosphate acyltransferase